MTLPATPDPNSAFDSWSGDVTSSENPLQVTVVGPTFLTASFKKPDCVDYFDELSVGASPADRVRHGSGQLSRRVPGPVRRAGRGRAERLRHRLDDTHWLGTSAASLANYTYSGRIRISDVDGGIGVTAMSQFPTELAYYRLRRYACATIRLAPVGTSDHQRHHRQRHRALPGRLVPLPDGAGGHRH